MSQRDYEAEHKKFMKHFDKRKQEMEEDFSKMPSESLEEVIERQKELRRLRRKLDQKTMARLKHGA